MPARRATQDLRGRGLGGFGGSLGKLGALLRGFLGARQVERRVDQRDVRERLWEIAEVAVCARAIPFAQEPNIVAQADEAFEQHLGIVAAAKQQVGIGEPEAAGEERAFASRPPRSEEHTSELQSQRYISYAVVCL